MDTNTACKSCFTFLFCSALAGYPGSRRLTPPFVTEDGTALLHSESHLRFKYISKLMGVEQRMKQQTASFLVTFSWCLTQPKTLARTDLWLLGGNSHEEGPTISVSMVGSGGLSSSHSSPFTDPAQQAVGRVSLQVIGLTCTPHIGLDTSGFV